MAGRNKSLGEVAGDFSLPDYADAEERRARVRKGFDSLKNVTAYGIPKSNAAVLGKSSEKNKIHSIKSIPKSNAADLGKSSERFQKQSIKSNFITLADYVAKQRRIKDFEARLLISNEIVGLIIGRNGTNIQRLQSDYTSSVNVFPGSGYPSADRIFTVSASDDTILKVIEDILPILNRTGDNDLRMLVHESQVECIIGKDDGKVTEMNKALLSTKAETKARIRIYDVCCPGSSERVVQILGRRDARIKCIREIIKLLKSVPVKGKVKLYEPFKAQPGSYGGYFKPREGGFCYV